MRRNAMGANLRQSILRSFGRYIAIVLIIALGSSLFVGLLMTKSDMVLTGQEFMDAQNMFDVRLVSTYGWDQEQVDRAKELPGVTGAEGVLYMDLIANMDTVEGDNVFRFYALSDSMNTFSLRGGRMPEREDECLADGYVFDESILGAKVTISPLNDEETLEDVAVRTFTVVGYGGSPIYMDMNRGTTSVGSGVLSAYFYAPKEAFLADYFPEIHLTLPENYNVYSEAYVAYMKQQLDLLEPEAELLGQQRFAAVKQEAEDEYADGYQEYLDGLQEYEDGKQEFQQELEDAWQELKDGEEEIIRGTRELNDAEKTLKQAEADLEAGRKQLDAKEAELHATLNQINASFGMVSAQVTIWEGKVAAAEGSLGMSEDAANARIAELLETDPTSSEIADLQGKLAALAAARGTYASMKGSYDQMVYAKDVAIPAGFAQIESARNDLASAGAELEHGWFEWNIGWDKLKKAHEDLKQGFIDYEEGKLEGEQELADAEQELKDAEEELREAREDIDALEAPEVFVLDRTSNAGYNSLDSASDIVQGVSRIIPVFFLLVASLVCITTMTRMVDEERTQIGTLKALGYSNAAIISKYLIYGGSGAVLGCGLGVLAGSFIFPKILWDAYKIMLYIREDVSVAVNWWLCGIVVTVYTVVILTVTWYCCRKALQEQPAELIRPKSPDPGKQLLIEKLPLWRRLSFLNKVMLRNIFRYKQRLAMMLVGIGGCTALLVTGFGLRDSIMGVVDYQFANVTVFDMEVYFTGHQTDDQQAEFLNAVEGRVADAMFFHQSSVDVIYGGVTKEIYMVSGGQDLPEFIDFHVGDAKLPLPGKDEVMLSVGVAEALKVSIGDTVTLRNADMQTMDLKVYAIYDNHVYNYGIVSPQTIEKHWGAAPEQQMAFLRLTEGEDAHGLSADISGMDRVMNVTISEDLAGIVNRMMEALDLVVVVIVFCAGLLAAVVLYNLTNININERIREIATIKVLGFNARETAAYVFKENLTLTIAGSLFGMVLGKLLLLFVMTQVKIDMVWFNTVIHWQSYVISFALTILAAFVVNFIFYFKLDKINMAEALKSVE